MNRVFAASVRTKMSVQARKKSSAFTLRTSSPDCHASIATAAVRERIPPTSAVGAEMGAIDCRAFHQQADGVQVLLGSTFNHDRYTL